VVANTEGAQEYEMQGNQLYLAFLLGIETRNIFSDSRLKRFSTHPFGNDYTDPPKNQKRSWLSNGALI
jgi:hypothetical protein